MRSREGKERLCLHGKLYELRLVSRDLPLMSHQMSSELKKDCSALWPAQGALDSGT